MFQFNSLIFRSLATFALIFALVAALRLAEAVFVPAFIAVFIAVLLHLPLKAMKKRGVPRPVGAVILTCTIVGLLVLFGSFVAEPAQKLARDYPVMLQELRGKLMSFQSTISDAEQVGEAIAEVSEDISEMVEDPAVQEVVVRDRTFLLRAASSFAESISTIVITLTICAFILAIRRPFLVFATIPYEKPSDKLHAARIWQEVEAHVSHYFFVTTLINIGLGTVVGLALWALGVPMPVFWGAVVGFLNYMPFVGPAIGATALLAVSIIQQDSVLMMLAPAAVYLTINFFEANFATPHLIGRKTNITPLAIILSLLFWGWLWGFVGLFVSVPMLVIINAAAQKIDRLGLLRRMLTPRARH